MKELSIGLEHVPGDYVNNQKLEEFADGQRSGMETIGQVDGPSDALAMDGGVIRCAGEAGPDNNSL